MCGYPEDFRMIYSADITSYKQAEKEAFTSPPPALKKHN